MYYLNMNQNTDIDTSLINNNKAAKIDVLKIKNLNLSELNKNIKEFEKNLINLDPSSISTLSANALNSTKSFSTANNNSSLYNSNKSSKELQKLPEIPTLVSKNTVYKNTNISSIKASNLNCNVMNQRTFQFNKSKENISNNKTNEVSIEIKNNNALSQGK